MKIVLSGRVVEVNRPGGGQTDLRLKLDGKVDGSGPSGRDVQATLDLTVADRFSSKLRMGDVYSVTIETIETAEE